MFDVLNFATIPELGKGDRQAIAPSTAGAANAVGVVFALHRQTVVEDVGDGRHINAPGGHVSGHQKLHLTVAQRHQTSISQALAQSTMQGDSRKTRLLQISRQAIALHLGAGKHDGLLDAGVPEPMVQKFSFVLRVVCPKQQLFDVAVALLRGVNLNVLGLSHHACGQTLNARRKGGAEHHGLATLNGELIDFSQVVGKAQIQHAIGLIDHEELNVLEFDVHGALQIDQATWRCHHEVGILQFCNLQSIGHAANHRGHTNAFAMLDKANGVMGHLLSELAGWTQHQSARCRGLEVTGIGGVFALGTLGWRCAGSHGSSHLRIKGLGLGDFFLTRLLQQGLNDGHQKCCRLATSGLRRNHQVGMPTIDRIFHRQGDHLDLNSRGGRVAKVKHSGHELTGQTQGLKGVGLGLFGRAGFGGEFRAGLNSGLTQSLFY